MVHFAFAGTLWIKEWRTGSAAIILSYICKKMTAYENDSRNVCEADAPQ